MIKRGLSVLLAVVMLLLLCTSCTSVSGAPAVPDASAVEAAFTNDLSAAVIHAPAAGYEKYMEKDGVALFYNAELGVLAVSNGSKVWYSTPPSVENDDTVQGALKQEMRSLLSVKIVNEQYTEFTANSRVCSVNQGTYEVKSVRDGFIVTYDFSRKSEQFKIPLKCTLADGGKLKLEVLVNQIEEYGDSRIMSIRIAPYFGAVSREIAPDGYIFVPDGSGAVIDLAKEKPWAEIYSKPIYGADASHTDASYMQNDVQIYLPVFGMNHTTNGYTAIVEKGAASCSIEAIHLGYQSNYASVDAVYRFRQLEVTYTHDQWGREKNVYYLSRYPSNENPIVSYTFMNTACGIADMAKVYRDYLLNEEKVEKKASKTPALTVEFIGGAQTRESVLGIMTTKTVAATTFDQAGDIISQLSKKGVANFNVLLSYFNKGSDNPSVPKSLDFEGSFGGKKGAREFSELLKNNGRIYYGTNFLTIAEESFGNWEWNSAATAVLHTKMVQYKYRNSTNSLDKGNRLFYYYKPSKIEGSISKFVSKTDLNDNEGILLSEFGKTVYSDLANSNPSTRTDSEAHYRAAMAAVKEKNIGIASDGANAYMLGNAEIVANTPVTASNLECISYSVPFYSIALHGIVDMSGSLLNNATTHEQVLMELLTGVQPCYRMTGENPNVLVKTDLNNIYNTYYKDWINEAATVMTRFSELHSNLGDQLITDFTRVGNCCSVTYENGTTVCVNIGSHAQQINGVTVNAGDYTVKESNR